MSKLLRLSNGKYDHMYCRTCAVYKLLKGGYISWEEALALSNRPIRGERNSLDYLKTTLEIWRRSKALTPKPPMFKLQIGDRVSLNLDLPYWNLKRQAVGHVTHVYHIDLGYDVKFLGRKRIQLQHHEITLINIL